MDESEVGKSPCVGICVLDEEGVRCIGCDRTIEEIIDRGKNGKTKIKPVCR